MRVLALFQPPEPLGRICVLLLPASGGCWLSLASNCILPLCLPPLLSYNIYWFVLWMHLVLVVAHGTFTVVCELLSSCGAWAPKHVGSVVVACEFCPMSYRILGPQPEIKPLSSVLILNHWITREIPLPPFYKGTCDCTGPAWKNPEWSPPS